MEKPNRDRDIKNLQEIIKSCGEDPAREGLTKTPTRFYDSLQFLTSGYTENVDEILRKAVFNEAYSDMVIVRDIELYSLCEHHMLPFFGRCHVGYIPNGKIIGLSKIPRVVNAFARRLQVQERLTHQIASALNESLAPRGVGIVMEAHHLCMMMRGVEKQNSSTITSSMLGSFRNIETRNEFLSLISGPKLRF